MYYKLYQMGRMTIGSVSVMLICSLMSCTLYHGHKLYDVVVLGAGTGGVCAAIQSARSGARTLYINPQPWLGGMLTSAGVSATDGNHRLPAGLWGEWRALLREHYGGPDSLFTGWVSNTMFEPSVGAHYFNLLADEEPLLTVWNNTSWDEINRVNDEWIIYAPERSLMVKTKIIVDGTDLGDVAAEVGVPYEIGMDSREDTYEHMAPLQSNDIIQDLTYVAILQDYGDSLDMTIPMPEGYDPSKYQCACITDCPGEAQHDCVKMLSYGHLPNDKYMINWPFQGNDFYANAVELSPSERTALFDQAKNHTLGFVYYIQTGLGYSNLGIAEEFPTSDGLALMPYHREGRRIEGRTLMNVDHILGPYHSNLYRTGIAVGDYPIDHHHFKNEEAPDIEFPPVPSFNIPIGSLMPNEVDGLIIADKAMSVTNIVNGASRLQPVIMQVGQTAGLIAAVAVRDGVSPSDVSIRKVQEELIKVDGYLMPYIDVPPQDKHFGAIQRIGATGLLRGEGVPYLWANQTWFYPDSLVESDDFLMHLAEFEPRLSELFIDSEYLNYKSAHHILQEWSEASSETIKADPLRNPDDLITRSEWARLLDEYIDPFNLKDVDFNGDFIID